MSPKWKYTDDARKRRYCEDCGKRLKKQEAVLCATCLASLLTDTMPDIEEVGDAEPEEETENETD